MYKVQGITQAYSQAPWRKQLQWIGLFMLVLILVAMVAGIYLSVSAQASTAGREIQIMYGEMEDIRRSIEDSESQLAFLNSNAVMEERAEELGFSQVESDDIFYILVPKYINPGQIVLADPPGATMPTVPTISPEYTESLVEWLSDRILYPASSLVQEVGP
jgi:cell division protein FtsB